MEIKLRAPRFQQNPRQSNLSPKHKCFLGKRSLGNRKGFQSTTYAQDTAHRFYPCSFIPGCQCGLWQLSLDPLPLTSEVRFVFCSTVTIRGSELLWLTSGSTQCRKEPWTLTWSSPISCSCKEILRALHWVELIYLSASEGILLSRRTGWIALNQILKKTTSLCVCLYYRGD